MKSLCKSQEPTVSSAFEQAKIDILQAGRVLASISVGLPHPNQAANIRIRILDISLCFFVLPELSYSTHAPVGKGAENKVDRYLAKRMTEIFIPYLPSVPPQDRRTGRSQIAQSRLRDLELAPIWIAIDFIQENHSV
jgi:hypothetical protein